MRLYTEWGHCSRERRKRAWWLILAAGGAVAAFFVLRGIGAFTIVRGWEYAPW